VQDVEKRLVQTAVDIRRQFNRRAEKHKVGYALLPAPSHVS